MGVEEIVKLICDNSVTVAILAYFCIRDWRFMDTLTGLLITLKAQTENITNILERGAN